MNKKIEDLQKSLSLKITKLKYQKKCKKLNISLDMFNYLINIAGIEKEEVKDILKIISKSESPLEFKNNIINYCKNKKKVVYAQSFLLGTITGNYPFCDFVSIWLRDEFNFDNFVNLDPQVIDILKEKFYEYIINDNKLKNNFLINKDGVRDYTVDLNKEFCDKIFDEVISGNFDIKSDEFNNLKKCYDITINYILETIGIYGQETIKNNFDFIMYDINKNSTETLENRKKSYMIKSSLRNDQIEKIDNINILIKRLKSINKKDAFDLLERLKIAIQDPVKNISEIEDIYLEFEVLFRQEIVETLFKPTEEYTLVENFTDIRPQLIHFFLRDFVANFMDGKVENLKKEIIIATDGKYTDRELNAEEQKEFEKRLGGLEAAFDKTKVNYFIDIVSQYTDSSGFRSYLSRVTNQISTRFYPSEYVFGLYPTWAMGIGFNSEGLQPDAVILSSTENMTTNMGINNIETNDNLFKSMSNVSQNLDERSEVVLFRRGMDFDTKASYIFITIDSREKEKSEEFINKALELAKKSNLKLVVYDIYKINKSYNEFISRQEEITEGKSK